MPKAIHSDNGPPFASTRSLTDSPFGAFAHVRRCVDPEQPKKWWDAFAAQRWPRLSGFLQPWTGIFPTNLDGVASVETVAPRSPAALAGVKPGDVLVSVDGVSLAGLGFRAIYYFLGGQPGTKVIVGFSGRSVTLTRVPDPQ